MARSSTQFGAAAIMAALEVPAHRWHRSVLVAIMGLPGSGKTYLARYLARRHPLVLMSTDEIRSRHGLSSGPETLGLMSQVASGLWRDRRSVLFDGIHLGRTSRDTLRALARDQGVEWLLVYTVAAPDIVERRLHERLLRPEATVAAGKFVLTPEHFARIASFLEEPGIAEPVWRVDTSSGDLEAGLIGLEQRLAWCLGTAGPERAATGI